MNIQSQQPDRAASETTSGNITALANDAEAALIMARMMMSQYLSRGENDTAILFSDLADKLERLRGDAETTLKVYETAGAGRSVMNAQTPADSPADGEYEPDVLDQIGLIAERGAAVADALSTKAVLEELNRQRLSGIAFDLLAKFEEIDALIVNGPTK